jgi:hypothetical protein
MLSDLEAMPRVCRRCCLHEGETDGPFGSDTCKHQFVKYSMWAGLVTNTWFDVRSEQTARGLFGETCLSEDMVETVRQLSIEEIRLIRSGKARLVITVERLK